MAEDPPAPGTDPERADGADPHRASGADAARTDGVDPERSADAGAQRPGDPGLLSEVRALRQQARAARQAYWFPLALFGLLTLASVPFYIRRAPPGRAITSGSAIAVSGGQWPSYVGGYTTAGWYLGYYWLVALLGGLLLTQLWYRWHARRVGVATPARGYVITTAVLTVIALAIPRLSLLPLPHPLRFVQRFPQVWPGDLVIRGTFPFLIIAAGLLILARAERSRALAAIAAVYTVAALLASLYDLSNLTARLGWNPGPPVAELPNILLPALVLLAAGVAAFAVQRRRWSRG